MNKHTLVLLCCTCCVASVAPVYGQSGAWEATEMVGSGMYVRMLFVATGGDVFAGTDSGLYWTGNSAQKWSLVGPRGVNDVAQLSPQDYIVVGREGLHKSSDGGSTWTQVLPKPELDECGDILQFTFISSAPGGELMTGGILEETSSGGCKISGFMYMSTSGGSTWGSAGPALFPWPVSILPVSTDTLIYGFSGGIRLYMDIGKQSVRAETAELIDAPVTSLVADDNGVVYAATGPFPAFLEVETGRGVYRSTDNGETWQQINEGLTDTTVTDLAVYHNGTLLASTLYGGVHRSTDGGDTWHPINSGLSSLWVTALAITEDGYVYAGTDRGIFRSTSAIATSAQEEAGLPEGFVLEQNYPNPFNPGTTISYALPQSGHVRLTIYDAMGREVRRLVDGVQPGGSHTAAFDAHGLPSGVYVYRLQAGAYIEERRMVLVR